MAIKITDVTITPQSTTVSHSILIQVGVVESDWAGIKKVYSSWQSIKDLFSSWTNLKNW